MLNFCFVLCTLVSVSHWTCTCSNGTFVQSVAVVVKSAGIENIHHVDRSINDDPIRERVNAKVRELSEDAIVT